MSTHRFVFTAAGGGGQVIGYGDLVPADAPRPTKFGKLHEEHPGKGLAAFHNLFPGADWVYGPFPAAEAEAMVGQWMCCPKTYAATAEARDETRKQRQIDALEAAAADIAARLAELRK